MSGRRPRILTYSHDGFGLGHFRRNAALVGAVLDRLPAASVLMATGTSVAGDLAPPAGVDHLKLPSIAKVANDHYVSERLGLDRREVTELRAGLLDAAVSGFEPDLVVVDFYPLGVNRELEAALRQLRRRRPETAVVLGWRDILDAPAQVEAEWGATGQLDAAGELFDEILVYGCREVYDPVREYRLAPAIEERIRFTGYLLGPPAAPAPAGLAAPSVVCTVGGGEDGSPTAWAFLGAMGELRRLGWSGELVTGPLMPELTRGRLAEVAASLGVTCRVFAPDMAERIATADVVVAMGGYNTVCEVLSAGTPAVVVPRVSPRREQHLRATRLAALGLLDYLEPSLLDGASLAAAVLRAAGADRAERRQRARDLLGDGRAVASAALAHRAVRRAALTA